LTPTQELLYDLVIVSAMHLLAEAAMEDLSGITIARFLVLFLCVFRCPSLSTGNA